MKLYSFGLLSAAAVAVGAAGLYWFTEKSVNKAEVARLTDNWIDNVVRHNCPDRLYEMFAPEASLFGTVSGKYRMGLRIKEYFSYFAKLPNIAARQKRYHVSQLGNGVYINNALITWQWDGLERPVVARMSFAFKGPKIYHLHSSVLPIPPKALKGEGHEQSE